ncbi:hypothetical protein [Candidatus Halocynthiibacter alkanivorans]|uniref:hypothetical protein n=1 Tax=Candidatus Halocynthiibacter alkanivorans TaxID=2267619 RepID=UPI00190F977A|nr:hypothetical protein [Candidatus Halocynthiibacter alkanivorans]
MKIKRFAEAVAYEAPHHFDCRGPRLAGFEAGGSEKVWVGVPISCPVAGPDPTRRRLKRST